MGASGGPSGMLEPDDESLLVFLAVHAAGHRFERPHWLENVHRAAAADLDWDEVWRIARESKVERVVHASLGSPAPGTVVPLLDGWAGATASRLTWLARGHFLPASVRDSLRERVALARQGFAPTRTPRLVHLSGLDLEAPRGVFVPWELSLELAASAERALPPASGPAVVDVGTGTGVIGVLLARARPDAIVIGTDTSSLAVRIARRNATRAGLSNARFVVSDLLAALPPAAEGRVSLIVSNIPADPPLVDVAPSDPRRALVGEGPDGMQTVRRLVSAASRYLAVGGRLVVMLRGWQWLSLKEGIEDTGFRVGGTVECTVAPYMFCILEKEGGHPDASVPASG